MSMTPSNFLLQLSRLITKQTNGGSSGVGIYKSHIFPLHSLKTSGGLTLTAATNPLVATLETNFQGVQWAAGDSTQALLNFEVPIDYDENSDTIILALMVNSAGNTNAPTFSANVYQKRAGTALSANLAPSASAAINKSATAATAAGEVTITVSGKGLKAKDVLTILLAPGSHSTDAVNLYGLEIRYKSTIAAYHEANR